MTHNCVGSTYVRTYITYGLFLNCTHVPTLSAVVYDYAECLGQTTSSPPEMWATCHCSRQGSGQEVTHGTYVRYVRTIERCNLLKTPATFTFALYVLYVCTVNFMLLVSLLENENPNWPIKCKLYHNVTECVWRNWLVSLLLILPQWDKQPEINCTYNANVKVADVTVWKCWKEIRHCDRQHLNSWRTLYCGVSAMQLSIQVIPVATLSKL